MELIRNFTPVQGSNTANLAVTASSQVVALPVSGLGNAKSVRIANVGTQTVFIKFTTSAGTATVTTDIPLVANTVETFGVDREVTHIAAIAGATGSTIYLTSGDGS